MSQEPESAIASVGHRLQSAYPDLNSLCSIPPSPNWNVWRLELHGTDRNCSFRAWEDNGSVRIFLAEKVDMTVDGDCEQLLIEIANSVIAGEIELVKSRFGRWRARIEETVIDLDGKPTPKIRSAHKIRSFTPYLPT